MICPVCQSPHTRVIRTVAIKTESDIYRFRVCRRCGHEFSTLEIAQPPRRFSVIKQDGKLDTFSYPKLFKSIQEACQHLGIPFEDQRSIFVNVMKGLTREVEEGKMTRVKSQDIGTLVMKHLRPVNRIAWLRYMVHFHDSEDIIRNTIGDWIDGSEPPE